MPPRKKKATQTRRTTKKGRAGEKALLTEQLNIRISPEDMERLDQFVEMLPFGSRMAMARVALQFGLDVLEKNPAKLLSVPPVRRERKGQQDDE